MRLARSLVILGVLALFCIPACTADSSVTTITRVSVLGSYSHHASLSSQSGGSLVGYNEDTEAVRGNITYEKTFQAGSGTGVQSSRTMAFNSTKGGSMNSREEVITHTCDEEGRATARAGSALEVNNASVSSHADAGNVSLRYDIRVHGTNGTSSPASGSARTHVDVAERSGTSTTSYEEVTSVDGLFTLDKEVSYGRQGAATPASGVSSSRACR